MSAVNFCFCDCHKLWGSIYPPVCKCNCNAKFATPETLSLCIHGVPVKFNNCQQCINTIDNFSLNNRINALHEHKIRQIDENRKIFRRVEEMENDSIIPLTEKIDELEDIIDDLEDEGNDHEARIDKLELKNIDRQITRISELEKFNHDFKDALKNDIAENKDMFIEIEKRLNILESCADLDKIKAALFEGAQTHASILRIEKLVNAHEEYLKRIDRIAMCDPDKVLANQKILNERLLILESRVDNKSDKVDKETPLVCPTCERGTY